MDDWPGPQDRPAILTVAMPADASAGGPVFGGWIMAQFDHAAGRAGRQVAGACLIRSVQELVFHAPLAVGSDFAVFARLAGKGRTSFTLELTGVSDPEGARLPVATGRFVMVAIDGEGRPRPLAD